MKATGIDERYSLTKTVVIHTAIVNTLTHSSQASLAIILYNLTINISTTMAFGRESIVAEADIVSVFTQSLHLIVNLLADTAIVGKSVVNEEEYLHPYSIYLCKSIDYFRKITIKFAFLHF